MSGCRGGFGVGFSRLPNKSHECKNLVSARRDPSTVARLLEEELSNGFLVGPFSFPPFSVIRVSPLGLVFGKYSNKGRLIVDMSSPHNLLNTPSLNDLINKTDYTLKYIGIDDATAKIQYLGQGTKMSKTDVRNAFKILAVKPEHWPYQCIKHKGKYYVYTRLVFGCRSSPYIFNQLSEAIVWIAKTYLNWSIPFIYWTTLLISHRLQETAMTLNHDFLIFSKCWVSRYQSTKHVDQKHA